MFDDLELFLSQTTNDYRATRMLEALKVIYEIKGSLVLTDIGNILMGSNDKETTMVLDEIDELALQLLLSSLSEFGVTVSEESQLAAEMPTFTAMGVALLNLDSYEDPYRLQAICQDADDITETFGELVEEITGVSAECVMDVLDTVSAELINRVLLENTAKIGIIEAKTQNPLLIDRQRSIVERLKSSVHFNREGIIEKTVAGTGLIGLDPDTILEACSDDLWDLRGDALAIACYQLACASDVATNSVIGTAKGLVEQIVPEDEFKDRQSVAFKLNRFAVPTVEVISL